MQEQMTRNFDSKVFDADENQRHPKPRRNLVNLIFATLQGDYGNTFARIFADGAQRPFDWKMRLADLAAPFTDNVLMDAVENCCRESPEYPPNLRQMEAEMRRLTHERAKRERDKATLDRANAMPYPPGMERVAGYFRQMQAVLNTPDDVAALNTPEKWLDTCLAHECMTWEQCADKTMPLTRAAALGVWRHQGANWDTPPGMIAAKAAEKIGGQTLAMFRQIASYMGRAGWKYYA